MSRHTNTGSRAPRKRRIMRAFKIREISGVDAPAQQGAVAVIMKRNDRGNPGSSGATDNSQTEGRTEKRGMDLVDALTSEVDGHQHGLRLVQGDDGGVGLFVSYSRGPDSDQSHDHPVIQEVNGDFTMGTVEGHTHGLDQSALRNAVFAFVTKAMGNDDDNQTAGGAGTEGEGTMTTDTKKADDGQSTVEELRGQLTRANSITSLSGTEKSHFDALDGIEAQDAFLAKSADGRKADVEALAKAATDADPVVYTTKDGIELRKSVGAGFIVMAKSNDALRDQVADLTKRGEDSAYEKRAEAELAHIPGDLSTRVSMLKAIDGIEDETQREAAHNALKAQNAALEPAFRTYGHSVVSVPGSASDELDQLAKSHNEANPDMTPEQAYSVVLKTERGSELYTKSVN